jgi:hypothetical protein
LRNPSVGLLRILLAELIVLGVWHDVLQIHSVVPEFDKSDEPQIVTTDIDNPPLVLVLKIVQTGEQRSQCVR